MIGVLLLNLGGPDSLDAVRPFLYNLFSDREIIKLPVPSFLQKAVAWVIARFRSKKVIEYYRVIGGKSPIIDITRDQAEALERYLNTNPTEFLYNPPIPPLERWGEGEFEKRVARGDFRGESGVRYKVYFGMRYSPPFIKDVIKKIIDDGIKKIIVLPLFPHYSQATTGSAFNEVERVLSKFGVMNSEMVEGSSGLKNKMFTVHCSLFTVYCLLIESWYDYPRYLDALSEKVEEGLNKFDNPENVQVLFSAHSLPKSFILAGDPYLNYLEATISGVLERIGPINWHLSFQSRSGPVRWLEPSTDVIINRLAEKGCKEILIVPISFVSDHLETLYEIDILYKNIAEKKGILLKRTESLNTSPKFIEALGEIVLRSSNIK